MGGLLTLAIQPEMGLTTTQLIVSSLPVLNSAFHWHGIYFPRKCEASFNGLVFFSGHTRSWIPIGGPGQQLKITHRVSQRNTADHSVCEHGCNESSHRSSLLKALSIACSESEGQLSETTGLMTLPTLRKSSLPDGFRSTGASALSIKADS